MCELVCKTLGSWRSSIYQSRIYLTAKVSRTPFLDLPITSKISKFKKISDQSTDQKILK